MTTRQIPDIMHDERKILYIESEFERGVRYDVGWGVTEIVPYEEHGWGSMVTWFAVYSGDEIKCRVPAATFIVGYDVQVVHA